jgi:hydrogenase expression/formation protein HypE
LEPAWFRQKEPVIFIIDIIPMDEIILQGHGSGGQLTHKLIDELFLKYFDNEYLRMMSDSAILNVKKGKIAFSTDSYVVSPLFFPGGDIGKLAVCGTVNDLSVSGATPLYLSASFIIEEGFYINDLKKIVQSMAEEAQRAGVIIVTGDTKVVGSGMCDKIFINTTGVGELPEKYVDISSGKNIEPGDKILMNGTIADHGMAIMCAREDLFINGNILSDCTSLNGLVGEILKSGIRVKFMRDATRGGVATVLNEVSQKQNIGIEIDESSILIKESVKGVCEILGYDPLYVANEGKVVIIVDSDDQERAIEIMRKHPLGGSSTVIGEITTEHKGTVVLNTSIGGRRIINMLSGGQLPRIC